MTIDPTVPPIAQDGVPLINARAASAMESIQEINGVAAGLSALFDQVGGDQDIQSAKHYLRIACMFASASIMRQAGQ